MILRTSVALCLTVASGSLSSDFKLALTPTVQNMVYLGNNLVFIYWEVLLHNLVVHVITVLAKVSVPSLL